MMGAAFARRAVLMGLAGALTATAPAAAGSTQLLDTTVSAGAAKSRICHTSALSAVRGVALRRLAVPAEGYLSVELKAARGDWDIAVFSGRRLVAASASRGATELAQGFVRKGDRLTVQSCRRKGSARTAALTVSLVKLDLGARTRPMKMVQIETPRDEDVARLTTLGLDLTEHGEDGHREAVIHTAAEERLLRAAGFTYKVTIADLAAASRADRRADRAYAARVDGSPLPTGREGYRRLADFQAEMKTLAEQHPELVKPLTLPLTSLEGRPVEGIEITENVTAQDGKPVFLMTGVHHAREWPSAENPFEFANELIAGYGTDERITDLLKRGRVIVVPVMNPDGYNLSREAPDDGTVYEYKRKNCRLADNVPESPAGLCARIPGNGGLGAGVDPNRNYGGDWGGPGAETAMPMETYRGTGPFSEPEVENVRRLISSRQVTTFITNHTQGSLILRPPGIRAFGPTIDEAMYKDLGDSMAAHNKYTSQYSFQLYDTSGTAEAWSYYATGGLGFTFEIHKGNFHLPYQDAVVEEYLGTTNNGGETGNRGAYFTALESTVNAARHAVIEGNAPPGSELTITRTVEGRSSRVQPAAPLVPWGEPIPVTDTLTSTLVPEQGNFEWHVNPSSSPEVYGGREATGPTTPDFTYTATATGDREFTVEPGQDNAALQIRADWPTNAAEDWSLELFRKNEDGSLTSISRSTVANRAFEEIETVHAGPGTYVIRATGARAIAGATIKADFLSPEPAQAWTLTCETPNGKTATTEVVVDRGERVDVGPFCQP